MLLETAGSGIARRETRELGSARMLWEEGWTQGPGEMEGENWNVPESSFLTEPQENAPGIFRRGWGTEQVELGCGNGDHCAEP